MSPFLLDDSAEDMDESCFGSLSGIKRLFYFTCIYTLNTVLYRLFFTGDEPVGPDSDLARDSSSCSYDLLKDLDPVAANRIHPNNYRKVGTSISELFSFRCCSFFSCQIES